MKRIFAMLSLMALLACCCLTVTAAGDEITNVCDTALLLSDEEWTALETQAEQISQQYQCAVYFITVDDYTDYGDGSIYETAKEIYLYNDLGWGEAKDGVLLLLSMADRDYTLIAYGYGNTAFTDYGKDYLSEQFLDDFADNDWAGGCQDYLDTCASMLKSARSGHPLDVGSRIKTWHLVCISLLLGFVLAAVLCGVWCAACKKKTTVRSEAAAYLAPGGMNINLRDDCYSHTTQTRTKIETSSGGSGGTTVDSDGFSGTSGKF